MMRAVGVMSGTSLDGIDVADVDVAVGGDGRCSVALRRFATVPMPAALRAAVIEALPPRELGAGALAALDVALGEAFGDAVLRCARDFSLDLGAIDVIGSHGQTISHAADEGATLQLGSGALIATRTGVTCVADFRRADIAAGGQGAPLVPYFDCQAFRHASEHRVALNIGGIANATVLPPGAGMARVTASDVGPGNVVIDECVRIATDDAAAFDDGGRMSAEGTIGERLLGELLAEPFFAQPWPKSTGRERFGAGFAQQTWRRGLELGMSAADIVATATALTAQTIADAIPPDVHRVIVSGGGVHNATLLDGIRGRLRQRGCDAVVEASDRHGIPADAKEAMAFALFGVLTLHGIAANVPACTGARHPAVLGTIAPGKNFASLMRRIWS